MFLVNKYEITNPVDCSYNIDVLAKLLFLTSYENIPHIILSGPEGSGKKTLSQLFLNSFYKNTKVHLKKVTIKNQTQQKTKDIEYLSGNGFIIIDPYVINNEKHIIHSIIKDYAMKNTLGICTNTTNIKFVVMYNAELLTLNSQAALRRIMEKYSKFCRFFMLTNNISKLIEPLRSRCMIFRVPVPTVSEVKRLLNKIVILENINITGPQLNAIIKNNRYNVRSSMWDLDCYINKVKPEKCINISIRQICEYVEKGIANSLHLMYFSTYIRDIIYGNTVLTLTGSDIIKNLLLEIIDRNNDDKFINTMCSVCSKYENNLVIGRRNLLNIDPIITKYFKYYYCHINNIPY